MVGLFISLLQLAFDWFLLYLRLDVVELIANSVDLGIFDFLLLFTINFEFADYVLCFALVMVLTV